MIIPVRSPDPALRAGPGCKKRSEYFVTICAHERRCIFGEISDHEMRLNEAGKIAEEEWFKTAQLRQNVELYEDEFVVMPNHVHGIIHLTDAGIVGALRRNAPTKAPTQPPLLHSLAATIRAYKSAVTYAINSVNHSRGFPVWQRNYYEHIISAEKEYLTIEAYIENNPANWGKDELWRENIVKSPS
jgi:REP element-mobilizing transposase RayT